MIVRSVSMQC